MNGEIKPAGQTLDITEDTCPMTFVRVRLALDRLESGEILQVLLCGEEPRRNVPRAAQQLGHAILGETEVSPGITGLVIQKR